MRLYPLPGHVENTAYPSVAENCDFSALDGSVKGVPDLVSVVSVPGTPRGMCYYKDRWYFVQGDKLYSWISGSPVQLASGIPGSDKAHFVPLSEHLVVRVADRIYTVVGNTASLVSIVQPPNAPQTFKRYVKLLLDPVGGTATYTSPVPGFSSDTFLIQDDTGDPEPGAHYFMKPQVTGDYPSIIGGYLVTLAAAWLHVSNGDRGPFQVSYWDKVQNVNQRQELPDTRLELPDQPVLTGMHRVVFPHGLAFSPQHGWRFWTAKRYAPIWTRDVYLINTTEPTHYALTIVSNGVESQPTYFEVVDDAAWEQQRYFTFFSGLPSGTWRLYRRDAAGVYRLVHEGTGSTYWDLKADSQLGGRLVVNHPPTSGSYAIGWNRRCVVAQGSKLYISDAGRFSYTSDSEIVDVDDTIIGLAVIRGTLYYATQNGWYALYGWGANLTTAQVYAEPPPVGYVGDALALRSGGCLLPGEIPDRRNTPRLSKSLHLGTRKYWLSTTGALYVWYAEQNKWTLLNDSAADVVYHEGEVYIQTSAGIGRYAGARRAFTLHFTIPLETPAQFYEGRVEGNGSGGFEVLNRQSNWRSTTGAFPLRLDRIDHRYYELTLRLTGNGGGSVIRRLLLHMEPREQLERR